MPLSGQGDADVLDDGDIAVDLLDGLVLGTVDVRVE